MAELPVSGLWSLEELQLLYELTCYWKIGSIHTPVGNQKVVEWASTVEGMNRDSKKYFISNRKYTIEECCDQFLSNWVNGFPGSRTLKPRWSTEEKELMQQAIVACPRRRGPVSQRYMHRHAPDLEEMKLFMNREAVQRGIRRRYYTIKGLERAWRKEASRSSAVQVQTADDSPKVEKSDKTASRPANVRDEISRSTDKRARDGDVVAHEADQIQLNINSSQVGQPMYDKITDPFSRPHSGGILTIVNQMFRQTELKRAKKRAVIDLIAEEQVDL